MAIGIANYKKMQQYSVSLIFLKNVSLRAAEFLIAFGTFDVAAALVFPVMVAICA